MTSMNFIWVNESGKFKPSVCEWVRSGCSVLVARLHIYREKYKYSSLTETYTNNNENNVFLIKILKLYYNIVGLRPVLFRIWYMYSPVFFKMSVISGRSRSWPKMFKHVKLRFIIPSYVYGTITLYSNCSSRWGWHTCKFVWEADWNSEYKMGPEELCAVYDQCF